LNVDLKYWRKENLIKKEGIKIVIFLDMREK